MTECDGISWAGVLGIPLAILLIAGGVPFLWLVGNGIEERLRQRKEPPP